MQRSPRGHGYYWRLTAGSGATDSNGVATHLLSLHVFHATDFIATVQKIGWNANGSLLKNVAPDGVDNSKLVDGVTPVIHDGGTFTCSGSTRIENRYDYWQHTEITYPRPAIWGFSNLQYDGFVPNTGLCGFESLSWKATPIDWRNPSGWPTEAEFVSAFNPDVSIQIAPTFLPHAAFAITQPGNSAYNSSPQGAVSLARWKVEPSMRVCDDRTEYDLLFVSDSANPADVNPNWSTNFPLTGKIRFG